MAQDWDIKARGHVCAGCTFQFIENQKLFSALLFTEQGYVRNDYCDKCWPEKEQDGNQYSVWKSFYKVPPAKPEPVLKKETAESLLRKLMEDDDPSKQSVMYILGVMMERNRIFVERDVRLNDDGAKVRIYEHKKTGETFVIPDPCLKLDELETVQAEVIALLSGEAESQNAPPQPPAEEQKPDGNQ